MPTPTDTDSQVLRRIRRDAFHAYDAAGSWGRLTPVQRDRAQLLEVLAVRDATISALRAQLEIARRLFVGKVPADADVDA